MTNFLSFGSGCSLLLLTAFSSVGGELVPHLGAKLPSPGNTPTTPRVAYSSCASCANCHLNCYQEHVLSMHARSFSNPVFLAQYQQDILPMVESVSGGFHQARSCTACHAPVAHKLARAHVVKPDPSTAEVSGVTCDFCHTIGG